jgi:4-hydroxybenzoate polyprenyltransferase
VILLFVLGLAALAVIAFLPSIVLGLSLLALPMIVIYPWMKRLTWWPQLFLGLTFNLGAWIGWAATGASFTKATVLLYGACIFWTLGYDTIYALQDVNDDRRVGIKSTAIRLGRDVVRFVSGWYAMMLLCLIFAGLYSGTGPVYLLGIVLVAVHIRWQVREVPFSKADRSAGALFRSNQWLGLALFAAIYLDRVAGVWPILGQGTN